MNVQEVLENYNTYKARISITESEIQELENEIVDIKSANLDRSEERRVGKECYS